MKLKSESYPNRIRRIAEDLSQIRYLYETEHAVDRLRKVADELEQIFKKPPLKKA
jgi:uncharacterized coiled-coil DUF342 family protein